VTDFEPLPHARAFELLPWLVNGTLGGQERDAVEQHTRACIVCRREIREQQSLYAAARARRTVDVSAEAGFDRLNSELDEAPAAHVRWQLRYATAGRFAAAAAAGVAVLALLLWLTPLPRLDRPGYSTLATVPAAGETVLDIVFADETTAAEIQALLDEIGGEIVAGPTPLGRYSVRLTAPAAADGARAGELLDTLAADRRVRFAGRSLSEVKP
jgi:hypothetical protein